MGCACASLSSCLEEVPVEIREWKPEHAPHATVMNRVGNRVPTFALLTIGSWKVAVPVNADSRMPKTAMIIIA